MPRKCEEREPGDVTPMEPEKLLHQVIQQQERAQRHIACRLHDDIGQELALVALRLSILRKTIHQVADIPAALTELQGLLSSAHKKIRDLEHAVYPRVAELNFVVAVEGLLDRFRTDHGAAISFVNSLDSMPPAAQAVPAFLILEDLLTTLYSGSLDQEVQVELGSGRRGLTVVLSARLASEAPPRVLPIGALTQARAAAHGGVIEAEGNRVTCSFPQAANPAS